MPQIITAKISQEEIKKLAEENFGDMIKLVVDIKKEIIAFGGELHADSEELLLDNGSEQKDLWGANIYPWKAGEERIEYTSLINIRPSDNNRSMLIESGEIKSKIKNIIEKLILNKDEQVA